MKAGDFREMVAGQDVFHPFVIQTRGGKVYTVAYPSSYWFPQDYETTVILAVRGQGITLLDIDAIDAVQFERELSTTAPLVE